MIPEPAGGWARALAALPPRRTVRPAPGGVVWQVRDTGGTGLPLLLLPGSLGTADMFVRQLAAPPGGGRLLAVDYPEGADPAPLAAGFVALLDALGLARARVLGSSFAAYWLQHAAALAPARFDTLFLCCGFVDGGAVAGNPLFDIPSLHAATGEAVKRQWADRLKATAATPLVTLQRLLLAEQPGETLRSRLLGAAEARPAPPVPATVRTVLLEGSDDPLIPEQARATLRAHVPHAAVSVIEGGGHYPHVLAPAAFQDAIESRLWAMAALR
ncbi:alpha/beta hydrolase [Roseomonas sp. NAR14]|uniref:Maspardin n=1 Tax=Roseomonas acroporae TaxID=2937791 RepID=A0A9X2BY45_9PROT|nr:alpha/beta hydrolase [Roseomonas acroporae]MCK8787991.1 alpha/beta hydrolase [Roseomonas acroporae]